MLSRTPPELSIPSALEEIEKALAITDPGYPTAERKALKAAAAEFEKAETALGTVVAHNPTRAGYKEPTAVTAARRELARAEGHLLRASHQLHEKKGQREVAFAKAISFSIERAAPHLEMVVATFDRAFAPLVRLAQHAQVHSLPQTNALREAEAIDAGLRAMRRLINATAPRED